MAIELEHSVSGEWFYKYITVENLKSILNALPDKAELAPNSVGNMSVFVGDENNGFYWTGYIDISAEEYVDVKNGGES